MIALAAVFVGCIVMDTLITNVASAVFMFPIALVLAGNMGVSFMPFAVTLMVGASCSFISPMGYQTNLMVYGPGGYKLRGLREDGRAADGGGRHRHAAPGAVLLPVLKKGTVPFSAPPGKKDIFCLYYFNY